MNHLHLPLEQLPANVNRLYVAFSGGLDSNVLLHRLLEYKNRYELVLWHVNHGLQQNASQMEQCAQAQAQAHDLELRIDHLSLVPESGNLEENARQQRYAVFSAALSPSDALLTAHHMNDQAETLLLNLMRGSGVAGLRAIAPQKKLGQGILFRPLLNATRRQLENYATEHQLEWVEDPSNALLHFDRNYIRHQVIPLLEKRWPAASSQLHRVCEWQNESHDLLQELALIDYPQCRCQRDLSSHECLSIRPLLALSEARKKNLIRYWLQLHGKKVIGYKRISQLLSQLDAPVSAMPVIAGDDYTIRRYQGALYLVDNRSREALGARYVMPVTGELKISSIGFRHSRKSLLKALKLEDRGQEMLICFRTEATRAHAQSHRLKRLFQQHQVPPWQRDFIPQVLLDGDLVGLALF